MDTLAEHKLDCIFSEKELYLLQLIVIPLFSEVFRVVDKALTKNFCSILVKFMTSLSTGKWFPNRAHKVDSNVIPNEITKQQTDFSIEFKEESLHKTDTN